MPITWRVAKSLLHLRSQVDHIAPTRNKANDGTIGDTRHAASKSDHNPNAAGVVTAMDITHDPANGCSAGKLAEALRVSKDVRIKYVIFNHRMFSSYESRGIAPWTWRQYTGANAHEHHVHVSVIPEHGDDERDWRLL